jgi:integrase/recombinase XerD
LNKKLPISILRLLKWPIRDREAWRLACRSDGWFEDEGPLARLAPTRLRVLEAAYGRWIRFLEQLETDWRWDSGCDALDAGRIPLFVDFLSASLAPRSVATYLHDLRIVAHALAPSRFFPDLERATEYFRKTAQPSKNKRDRVVPSRDLFNLGFMLMDAASASGTRLQQASQFRDGLMIALLAACPIRIANLTSIKMGLHLVEASCGYRLVFPGSEVKNRHPLDYPLPEALTKPISRYCLTSAPLGQIEVFA